MKKKKKAKPRIQMSLEETVFKKYFKEMEELKENSNIKFNLFQSLPEKDFFNGILKLTYFYDQNFIGNKDFMHVPDVSQIYQNVTRYPVILATQKNEFGENDIIGATTVKIENNLKKSDNPFFPTSNENVMFITGVLAKQNIFDVYGNKIKGIGKQLYKSAIKGAYELNKESKVRLACEIDCRNKNSFDALCKTVKSLQEDGLNVGLNLVGYYEIMNKNIELKEAPTFLFEIDFQNKGDESSEKVFSYVDFDTDDLFKKLSRVIKRKTYEKRSYLNMYEHDFVIYHEIKPVNALNMIIEPGSTAIGNERTPRFGKVQVESMNIL